MNKVILMGRLTREIDVKTSTTGTSFTRNSIAVDRKGKDKETDFFNITGFGKTCEFMEKYLHKGSKVVITGRLQNDSYTDRNGNKVTSTSVIIEEIEFAEPKGDAPKEENKETDFLNVPASIVEELPFS